MKPELLSTTLFLVLFLETNRVWSLGSWSCDGVFSDRRQSVFGLQLLFLSIPTKRRSFGYGWILKNSGSSWR